MTAIITHLLPSRHSSLAIYHTHLRPFVLKINWSEGNGNQIKLNSLKATEMQDMIYFLSSNLYWLVWIQCDKLDWVVTKIKTYNLKKKILPCSYCESKQQTPLNACPILGLLCLYYNNMHIMQRKKILFYGHDQPIFSILGFFFFFFFQFC